MDGIYERFKNLKSRAAQSAIDLGTYSDENLTTAVLPYTFRFGNNLAAILDDFVYQNGFTGRTDFDTDITIIHAKKRAGEVELRTNCGEADAIKRYIMEFTPTNYVVMAPYKKQRALLMETLRGIADPDDILTIHASQGREWDTVIISATDSARPFLVNSSLPQGLHALNTAISRAKKNIIIACDCDYWSKHSNSQLIGKLTAAATYVFEPSLSKKKGTPCTRLYPKIGLTVAIASLAPKTKSPPPKQRATTFCKSNQSVER